MSQHWSFKESLNEDLPVLTAPTAEVPGGGHPRVWGPRDLEQV